MAETVRANKVGTYAGARAVTIVVTIAVWAALLGLIGSALGGALARPDVSAGALRVSLAVIAPLAGLIAAHAALTGLIDGFALGRFAPPPDAPPRSRNPWGYGLLAAAGCAPVGLIAGSLAPTTSAAGYTAWFVTTGAISAALAAIFASGGPARAEIAAVRGGARYAGTFPAYRVWRHAVPQGLVNLVANGCVGLALVAPGGVAGADQVVPDAVIATWIVASAASFGSRNVARGDARAGLVDHAGAAPSRVRQALGCAALAVPGGLVAWGLCSLGPLSLPALAVFKGLWSGVVAAAVAYAAAGWGATEGSATPR